MENTSTNLPLSPQTTLKMELDGMAILKKSWIDLSKNIPLYAALMAVAGVVLWVSSMIPLAGNIFFAGPLGLGLTVCLLKLRRQESFGFEDFFWAFRDFNRYLHAIILTALVSVGTIVGMIFLILPGIWFMVASVFGSTLFVLYKQDGLLAVQKSLELVKGRWWNIAGFLGIIFVVNVIGFFCFVVGLLVSTPLSALMMVAACEALLADESSGISNPQDPSTPLVPPRESGSSAPTTPTDPQV